jgi:hypothetical protein
MFHENNAIQNLKNLTGDISPCPPSGYATAPHIPCSQWHSQRGVRGLTHVGKQKRKIYIIYVIWGLVAC